MLDDDNRAGELGEPEPIPATGPPPVYAIAMDAEGIVDRAHHSNLLPEGFTEVSQEVWAEADQNLGQRKYEDGELVVVAPPLNRAMQPTLSDVQFFRQLAQDGVISREEALAAVASGAIPPVLGKAFAGLPDEDRFAAEMRLAGTASFTRLDPLVGQIQAALEWPDETLDTFWSNAGAL